VTFTQEHLEHPGLILDWGELAYALQGVPGDPDIASQEYRKVMAAFCTGLTIVTGMAPDGPRGMTCQSFSALSLDPPLVLVCPGVGSSTWPAIAATGNFAVNVLSADQRDLCLQFAKKGGDKFTSVAWQPGPHTRAPLLDGVLATIECRVDISHNAGDHYIVVGRVLGLTQDETGSPLLFFRSGFGQFAAEGAR
jgi:3-hydroxy-9,10-secoandrosta-1,3,5(10)-triene-9,17-dione monooxygenase reductase component